MRIFGVLVFGFAIVLFGFNYVNKYVQRRKQLNKIRYAISIIKQNIEYKKLKVNEILIQIIKKSDFSFLDCDSVDVNTICFKNSKLLIDDNEKLSLFNFLKGLGKTDLNGQLKHCDLYFNVFDELLNNCKEKNDKKIKLFPTLSVLFGLLIVILLL